MTCKGDRSRPPGSTPRYISEDDTLILVGSRLRNH